MEREKLLHLSKTTAEIWLQEERKGTLHARQAAEAFWSKNESEENKGHRCFGLRLY